MNATNSLAGKTTHKFGRLRLELDRSQVFPDDPGAGTPAIVVALVGGKEYSSTWCAQGEGTVGCDGTVSLTCRELKWLDQMEGEIERFLYGKIT